MKIAESAALSSSGLSGFLEDNLGFQSAPFLGSPKISFVNRDVKDPQSPVDWIRWGAYHEDDDPRYGNHFYTLVPNRVVGKVQGLTDWHESLILPGHTTNSYAWGTVAGLPSPFLLGNPDPPTNTETWECARGYQFAALTNSVDSDRDARMAHMLYALGHILHLNQDLSQPDHVRNDEHFHPWHRFIEKFGSRTYINEPNAFPFSPHGWPYWQSQGFLQILDFWDRGLYAGGSSGGLDADASSGGESKLGLAEFSNGNFLGEDATYAEFFKPTNIHYFPFPSLKNTTQPQINPHNLAGTVIDTVTLKNGQQGSRVYLSKTSAGINIIHHSAWHYLPVRHPGKLANPAMRVALTIQDTNVLQEYHSILIPKAVEYSAGILDYFFRGTISVATIGANTNSPIMTNLVVNTSGQSFSGGAFHLFFDDISDVRTEITDGFSTTYSGSLSPNDSITVIFTKTNAARYILVYQGSIGATDPADNGIAVAARTFTGNEVWHNSFESLGNAEPGEGEYFCEGWSVDSGNVDVVQNGSFGSTASEGQSYLDLDGSEPGTISTNIVTIPGQAYQLTFAWSRNPDSITGENFNGDPVETPHIPSVEILIDDGSLATVNGSIENSWADLQWQSATYNFTATSSSTKITFHSLDDGSSPSGILLDAIDVKISE